MPVEVSAGAQKRIPLSRERLLRAAIEPYEWGPGRLMGGIVNVNRMRNGCQPVMAVTGLCQAVGHQFGTRIA